MFSPLFRRLRLFERPYRKKTPHLLDLAGEIMQSFFPEGGFLRLARDEGSKKTGWQAHKQGTGKGLVNHLCPSFESIGKKRQARGRVGGSFMMRAAKAARRKAG
jgi:hypothetical protein